MQISTVSLQDFQADVDRHAAFVQVVGEALKKTGFLIVEKHLITEECIDRAYAAAGSFFAQSESVKCRCTRPETKGQRGYTPFGREYARDNKFPDLKEFFQVGRDENGLLMPNAWPDEVPDFRQAITGIYEKLEVIGMKILEACGVYLGLEPNYLPDLATGSDSIMRLIHYPPMKGGALPGAARAAGHQDINFVTLLIQATQGGLELQTPAGKWMPVETEPNQIIVDSGDMFANLTNGLFRSTMHRVVNPRDFSKRRLSMPFFMHPTASTDLTPREACVEKTGGGIKFPSWTAGEFLTQRLTETGMG